VTITGANLTGASAVNFGSAAATGVTVNSSASITCTSPPVSAGAVDVTVTTAFGASATNSSDEFTYITPPPVVVSKTIPGLNQSLLNAAQFVVSAPATAVAGTVFNFTVTAQTPLNTTATGYNGTVSFTSDDQKASLPPFKTLTNGAGTFSAVMRTPGLQTITATDASNPAMTGSANITVSAAGTSPPSNSQTVIHFHIGSTSSDINGLAQSIDTAPIISNGRTLLPIKYVAGPLGATISWDAEQKMVTVTLNGTTIQLWIGKGTANVNGVSTPIDPGNPGVTPMIVNGHTMLPLAFIAKNLGCQVGWDANTSRVTVTSTGAPRTPGAPETSSSPAAGNSVTLSSLTAGETVQLGGYTWIVLDPGAGYLLMQDTCSSRLAFESNTSLRSVSFDPSSMTNVASYLNQTFYNSLPSAAQRLIQSHSWTTGNDTDDTSSIPAVTNYIGLLSYDEYKQYQTVTGVNTNFGWLTRTPYSINPTLVWHVMIDGGLALLDSTGPDGVRPAIYVNPDISLSASGYTVTQ
jgi:hypothetical protein